MHEPTSYFILCLSLILSLSSSSRSYLFLLSFIYAASAWLSLLKFSLAYSLPQFFILSHCAAGPRPARNQSHRRRSLWGGTRSPPIWGVHGATAPESRRPPTVPARAAHHPLCSYAVRRSSEPHRDASLTKWKPPGPGPGLDVTSVNTATSSRRLDGDGLLRLDGGVGESSTKAMAVCSDEDGLRFGSWIYLSSEVFLFSKINF
jgi:hypothetical protein